MKLMKHNNTMASSSSQVQNFIVIVMATLALTFTMIPTTTYAQLTPDYYEKVCPQALPIIKSVVKKAIIRERRLGASLLRLHFHDCFVNGCDGSVLLDDTPLLKGEKTAFPNLNSIRGFEVVDKIKAAVDQACKGPVVSCADILAIAARDSVAFLGGQNYWYQVLLGRKDARTASWDDANTNLPPPSSSFSDLLFKFFNPHGLDLKDLVVLSGGHTIGFAKCSSFKSRLYNDTNIDYQFASSLRNSCPLNGNGDTNLSPLDSTVATFDTKYYSDLLYKRGLLHSDQELFKGDGGESDNLVKLYSSDPYAFAKDFGYSMVKMGNIKPLVGYAGEVRYNCRRVNY